MINKKRLSILTVILAATLWGSTGTVQALIPEYKEPLVTGAVRLYLAAIFLFLIFSGLIFGPFGIILAIPTYTAIKVISKEFFSENRIVKELTKNL